MQNTRCCAKLELYIGALSYSRAWSALQNSSFSYIIYTKHKSEAKEKMPKKKNTSKQGALNAANKAHRSLEQIEVDEFVDKFCKENKALMDRLAQDD